MTANSKIKITDNLGIVSPYSFERKLPDVIDELQEMLKAHGPDARLDWNPNYWHPYDSSPTPSFFILKDRLETDEEYEKRQEEYMSREREKFTRDRLEFERLSKIFGEKR